MNSINNQEKNMWSLSGLLVFTHFWCQLHTHKSSTTCQREVWVLTEIRKEKKTGEQLGAKLWWQNEKRKEQSAKICALAGWCSVIAAVLLKCGAKRTSKNAKLWFKWEGARNCGVLKCERRERWRVILVIARIMMCEWERLWIIGKWKKEL